MDPDPPEKIDSILVNPKGAFNDLVADVGWCIDEIKKLRRALGYLGTAASFGEDPIRGVQQTEGGDYVLGTYQNGIFTPDA